MLKTILPTMEENNMKKCVICGKEIKTEIDPATTVFAVNLNPCICSECVMELFDMYCEKDENINQYKTCIKVAVKTVIMNYPEELKDSIEDYVIAELQRGYALVGKNFDDAKAREMINNLKDSIEREPERFEQTREYYKNNKNIEEDDKVVMKTVSEIRLKFDGTDDIQAKFREVIPQVKQLIKGQDTAVEQIGRVFLHNQQCIRYNSQNPMQPKILKQNMILVGPSGTGKTATITEYCRLLGLPYVIADMTNYTQAGYQGACVESIFASLVREAGGDIELAQKGIIIMDEADKNENKESSSEIDVGGKGVIDSLLKKIEGCKIELGRGQVFDSANTTFVAMGVYPRLYDIRKERMTGKRAIGFAASSNEVKDYGEFISDDFVKHGFTKEYVGRFSAIVEMKDLTDEIFSDILRNSKNSAYRQYKSMLDYFYNVELEITKAGEKSIIEQARKYNTGARGLHRCISKILEKVETDFMLRDVECKKVIIDKNNEIRME